MGEPLVKGVANLINELFVKSGFEIYQWVHV